MQDPETRAGPVLEGIFRRDRLGWPSYSSVDGRFVSSWLMERLRHLPNGAYVRLSAEVLDPHPQDPA